MSVTCREGMKLLGPPLLALVAGLYADPFLFTVNSLLNLLFTTCCWFSVSVEKLPMFVLSWANRPVHLGGASIKEPNVADSEFCGVQLKGRRP